MIEKDLLDILVCPACKKSLVYEEPRQRLICKDCKKAYPIREEIPVMLIEEAEDIQEEEKKENN